MRFLWYTFLALFSVGMLGLIVAFGGVVFAISYFSKDLPDYTQLKDYEPPVVTRVYAGDGRLISEFAEEKRVFVPIEEIPPIVKQAFISAEDQNFYTHPGLDYYAIARAAVTNFQTGSMQGASTITQQVAKNFLLTNERTYKRKIREAILSLRMERAMSKDRLLELYMNEIYLGEGSYGVAAAALNYFNKSLEELTPADAAFLAALPKAPSHYHPVRHYDAAVARRNWVLDRMEEDNYLTRGQVELAKATPIKTLKRDPTNSIYAPYFTEEVRRQLITQYGEDSLYGGGLAVRTSVDPNLQQIAVRVLREGLVEYDKRHGYRGPLAHWDNTDNWEERLKEYVRPPSMLKDWKLAVVLNVTANEATIGMDDGTRGKLEKKYLTWARKTKKGSITFIGGEVTSAHDVLNTGDVIMVDEVTLENGEVVNGLRQIPEANGALVAMDPHTGRVLAMQGGWSYEESEFNRATQALRQPGSSFKPFVYLTGLSQEFTPATLILDAPIVVDQGPGMRKWRPTNYKGDFNGPTPLRVGIEKSRNLMTVRLAEHVGMEAISETAQKFGVMDHASNHLSYALGAGETTVLKMTTGYAQFVNGGKRITPTLIDRIQDRRGTTIYNHDTRPCVGCGKLIEWEGQPVPEVPDTREQIADARHAYQIVSMLEGVVQRGTGVRIKELGRPLAGKTGTTNESKDVWFIGFSPDLVVGVFVGFDDPRSLGRRETGSSVAVPIFKAFMEEALEGVPPMPFRVPPGIRQVRVDAEDGTRAQPGDKHVIWEAFLSGTEPTDKTYILDSSGVNLMNAGSGVESRQEAATVGTGGLY